MSGSFIVLILLVGAGFVIGMQIHIIEHEDAHEEINKHNGCLNTSKSIEFFHGSVKCLSYDDDVSDEELSRARLLHGFNEVIGYNVSTLIYVVFFCTIIVVMALFAFNRGGG